jgi:hypothetical protein
MRGEVLLEKFAATFTVNGILVGEDLGTHAAAIHVA